jgi:hypothetical protein
MIYLIIGRRNGSVSQPHQKLLAIRDYARCYIFDEHNFPLSSLNNVINALQE